MSRARKQQQRLGLLDDYFFFFVFVFIFIPEYEMGLSKSINVWLYENNKKGCKFAIAHHR